MRLLAAGIASQAGLARAESLPDELCLSDPCIVTGIPLDDNTIFDFGGRALVVQGTLDVVPGGVGVTLDAGSITVGPIAQIRGRGFATQPGGTVTLIADGDISFQGALTAGAILLTGLDGGSLAVTSRFGSVLGTAKMDLTATSNDGFGGTLDVSAAVAVSLSGLIELQSLITGIGLGGSADFGDGAGVERRLRAVIRRGNADCHLLPGERLTRSCSGGRGRRWWTRRQWDHSHGRGQPVGRNAGSRARR